jgi:hypothetical protein
MPITPSRIRYSGGIARKGETAVYADSDTGEIGVMGRSLQEMYSSFEDLVKIVGTELGVNLHDNVKFYWAITASKISSSKVPRQVLAKVANKEYVDRFSKIIGTDLSSFTIRLGTKGANPNREDWFEISIEPDLINDRFYYVGSVFRKRIKNDAETFVKSFEGNSLNLIRLIEAEAE